MSRPKAALQTFHALQASDLANAFGDALQKLRMGPGDYRVELTAPDGPSTAGGIQAMQHVRLVSAQADLPTLVVGHANHAAGLAELRTFECMDALYRKRFGRTLVLDRAQYEQFLGLAEQVLAMLRLKVTIVGISPEVADAAAPVRTGMGFRRAVVASVVLGAISLLGIGFWLFR